MANVSFKLGLQEAIDQLLIAKTGAEEGSFYLTSDTHRLYIGGKASPGDTDVQVFPVNEGVTTVDGITNLPTYDTEAQKDAAAGRFYYVADSNILCVFNGQDWIQINANDDTGIRSTEFKVGHPDPDKGGNPEAVEITYVLTDTTGKERLSSFSILATDGLTTTITGTTVEIAGNKYTLTSKETDTDSGKFEIALGSENLEEIHKVILLPGENVFLTAGADPNTITINADDTKIEKVSVAEGYTSLTTEGFRVQVTDSNSKTTEGGFNPKIKYGKSNHVTAKFDNSAATLDIYTSSEIDGLLKALNAMTYKGTIGLNGSFATALDVKTTEIIVYKTVVENGVTTNIPLELSIGDTMLCNTSLDYTIDKNLPPGTMLIARSKTGIENANGGIDSKDLTFDIIEATQESDTTYIFDAYGENGIVLKSNNQINSGSLDFIGENGLEVEWTGTKSTVTGAWDRVIHVKHNPVARTDTKGTAEQQSATMTMTIPVVTKVETDNNGHITGVQTTDYTVVDSTSQVSKVDLEANQYVASDEKTQVGSITTKVTTVDGSSKQTMQEDSFNIVSKSLEIKVDNNYGSTEGTETTTRQHGLSINMVWGEF